MGSSSPSERSGSSRKQSTSPSKQSSSPSERSGSPTKQSTSPSIRPSSPSEQSTTTGLQSNRTSEQPSTTNSKTTSWLLKTLPFDESSHFYLDNFAEAYLSNESVEISLQNMYQFK